MRKNPLVLLGLPASGAVYLVIRELGHLIACSALGIPFSIVVKSGFLPTIAATVEPTDLTTTAQAWLIMSGPIAGLLVGYVLLVLIARRRSPASVFVRLLAAMTCYLTLILDPIYYTIIPIFSLGGEPERLANLLGVPISKVQMIAIVLLLTNSILSRRIAVPFFKGDPPSGSAPASAP